MSLSMILSMLLLYILYIPLEDKQFPAGADNTIFNPRRNIFLVHFKLAHNFVQLPTGFSIFFSNLLDFFAFVSAQHGANFFFGWLVIFLFHVTLVLGAGFEPA